MFAVWKLGEDCVVQHPTSSFITSASIMQAIQSNRNSIGLSRYNKLYHNNIGYKLFLITLVIVFKHIDKQLYKTGLCFFIKK